MSLFPPIPVLDSATLHKAEQKLSTTMGRSFGRLGELGIWISGCQAQFPPAPVEDIRLVIFAGDHGLSQHSSSLSTPGSHSSREIFQAVEAGETVINSFAHQYDIRIDLHDINLDFPPDSNSDYSPSSGRIDRVDAMDSDRFQQSVDQGVAIANRHIDEGAQVLLLGDIGVGNDLVSTAIIATLLQKEPTKVLPRTADIDDEIWKERTSILRDSMFRVREDRRDVEELGRRLASPAMVAMAAFLAQSSLRRTPVILDGITGTAVGLLAEGFAPGSKSWWLSGMNTSHPAHTLALAELGLSPILNLDVSLGQGVGAAAVVPLLRVATNSLSEIDI